MCVCQCVNACTPYNGKYFNDYKILICRKESITNYVIHKISPLKCHTKLLTESFVCFEIITFFDKNV